MGIDVTTVGDLIDREPHHAHRDAVVFPDARVTYAELAEGADRFARGLAGLGVGAGSKVAILMPNCLDYVLAFFGAARLGAIVVPVNTRFKAFELGQVVAHADVEVILTAAGPDEATDFPALLARVLDGVRTPLLRHVVDLGGATAGMLARADLDAAAVRVDPGDVSRARERVRVRDVAMLMYTSGTTARPKGCLLTHEALVRHGANVARARFALTADDRFWDPLPLFHCGGIVPMLGCFAVGAAFCHAGHFDPDVALRTLEEERCTVAYPAFETIWLAVLDHPRFADADLSALRAVQNIAVPEKLELMQERLPHAVEVSSYGATECASNLTLPLLDDPYEVRMRTLGHPLPGMELRICDPETRAPRPAGDVGELCYRGYGLFEGYYKEPELTAAAFDDEGFFHSGDLAKVDVDGRLIYAGRLKDMLKVGGENVSALEVEGFLARHPAVGIVQVVGAPDARYTEVPAAFVQLRRGHTATEEELIDFCVGEIATFKVPRHVRFVDDWPMSGTKIQKYVLRERIAHELQETGVTQAPRVKAG